MNKKIIFGLSLVLIAVMAIGSASALDFSSILGGGDGNQTVTIDGIDFNIPEGFKENKQGEAVDEMKQIGSVTYKTNGKVYEKGNDCVAILVADYGKYNVTDKIAAAVGGEPKTFNGVNGYFTTDGEYKVFNYAKNNKLVVISSTDENIIGDFLIG